MHIKKKILNINKQSGAAISMALFLIFAISIFALSTSGIVSSDLIASKKYKNGIKASFLARAGIEKAIHVLLQNSSDVHSLNDKWRNDPSLFKEINLDGGFFDVGYYLNENKVYGIIDEESKLNINLASKEMLVALPGINEIEALKIIGYREKTLFHKPEELVTRGIIEEKVFNGTNGLKDKVTVWGSGKININTASREVLLTIPGLSKDDIEHIFLYRSGPDKVECTDDDGIFRSDYDLKSADGNSYPKDLLTVRSDTFCIKSEGVIKRKSPTRAKRVVEVVVNKDHKNLKVLYWNML